MSKPEPDSAARWSVDAAFAELSTHLLDDGSLADTLQQVATLAQRVVPEATEVSITLVDGDRAHTAAFTGSVAALLDERQYQSGFGPCLGAAASGQTIRTDTDDPESLYPDFAHAVRRAGMRHTLSVALPVPGRVVGALNLYGAGEDPFGQQAETDVGTFAGYVGVTLANASLYADAVDLATQLRIAMASRAVIEQAKGVVMAQNGCSAEKAFTLLARLSQSRNVKLRDLAQDVLQQATSGGRHPSL